MTLSTSHPSRATPTQMALHAEAVERRRRLGIKPVRPLRYKMTELRVNSLPRSVIRFVRDDDREPHPLDKDMGVLYTRPLTNPKDEQYAQAVDIFRVTHGITAHDIVQRVAAEYGVPVSELTSFGRCKRICAARFRAIHEIRKAFPEWSTPRIGRIFGGRDHTTIVHALKKYSQFPEKYQPEAHA